MRLIGFHNGTQNIGKKDVHHLIDLDGTDVRNLHNATYTYRHINISNPEIDQTLNTNRLMRLNENDYGGSVAHFIATNLKYLVRNPVYEVELCLVRNPNKGEARLNITSLNAEGKPLFSLMKSATSSIAELVADLYSGEHRIIDGNILGTRTIIDINGGGKNGFKLYRGQITPYVI